MVRMKAVARSYAYWPGIDKEIESHVKACGACQNVVKSPDVSELHSWPIPSGPWERVHADIAGPVKGTFFFVIVDAYSKWLEVFPMKTITSSNIISALRDCFSRFGYANLLVTDNGSQFTSHAFDEMCKEYNTKHITTAPYHPQSNAKAERHVDVVKRTMKKLSPDSTNLKEHLFTFLETNRSTPDSILLKSPFELMFGRKMKTINNAMLPQERPTIIENIAQNEQFNRHRGAKPKSFDRGDSVFIKVHQDLKKFKWVPATIIEALGNAMYVAEFAPKHLVRAH